MSIIVKMRSLNPLPPDVECSMREFLRGLPDEAPWGYLTLHLEQLIEEEIRARNAFCIFCHSDVDDLEAVRYFDAICLRKQILQGQLSAGFSNYGAFSPFGYELTLPDFDDHICEDHRISHQVDRLIGEWKIAQAARKDLAHREREAQDGLGANFKTWLNHRGRKGEFSIADAKVYLSKGADLGIFPAFSKADYKFFLASLYWAVVSALAKHLTNHKCSHCGTDKRLVTHHMTYENLGKEHENLSDLMVLCNPCHTREHGRLRREGIAL